MTLNHLRAFAATAALGLSLGLISGSALAQASFAAPPQIPYGAPISTEAAKKPPRRRLQKRTKTNGRWPWPSSIPVAI